MIGPSSFNIPGRQGILVALDAIRRPIPVASTVRDTANTPTTTLRGGLCLAKSGSTYIRADDASIAATPAKVLSDEAGDGDWTGKILSFVTRGGLAFTVTLGTIASSQDAADDLNADETFEQAGYFADVETVSATIRLRIRMTEASPDAFFSVSANLASIYGGSTEEAAGSYPECAVLNDTCDILGFDGVAAQQDFIAITAKGRFLTADLIGATELFKAAMRAQGCTFEAA